MSNYMTKYEKAQVLGLRATQISMNAKVEIDTGGETDPLRIAQMELRLGKIPFIIRRHLPNGEFIDVDINTLIVT